MVEVKSRLTEATLGMVVHQLQFFPQKGLIVTNYVNPRMAERLKALDMPFLDMAGNVYLNEPPVYVYVKGNRPVENPYRTPPTRAFQPSGLKVLFALLCEPELGKRTLSRYCKGCGVALGTVGRVLSDLRDLGYLVNMNRSRFMLIKKDRLVERWVTIYPSYCDQSWYWGVTERLTANGGNKRRSPMYEPLGWRSGSGKTHEISATGKGNHIYTRQAGATVTDE